MCNIILCYLSFQSLSFYLTIYALTMFGGGLYHNCYNIV